MISSGKTSRVACRETDQTVSVIIEIRNGSVAATELLNMNCDRFESRSETIKTSIRRIYKSLCNVSGLISAGLMVCLENRKLHDFLISMANDIIQ